MCANASKSGMPETIRVALEPSAARILHSRPRVSFSVFSRHTAMEERSLFGTSLDIRSALSSMRARSSAQACRRHFGIPRSWLIMSPSENGGDTRESPRTVLPRFINLRRRRLIYHGLMCGRTKSSITLTASFTFRAKPSRSSSLREYTTSSAFCIWSGVGFRRLPVIISLWLQMA